MKTINKMETLQLNLTLIYFQPNASAYSPVTAGSEHWEHCWIHFHTFAFFPPQSQDRPILCCSRHLCFFPWLWLWLEEQCQPLSDALFAAKCMVCLVEEECCRRDIELAADFGGGRDQMPRSIAACRETCAAEQLHRTAPIQTASSGGVTKQDSAGLGFISQNSHCPPPSALPWYLRRALCALVAWLPSTQKFSFPSWCTEVSSTS